MSRDDKSTEQALQQRNFLSGLGNLDLRFKLALPFCLILLIVITTFWLLMQQAQQQSAQYHANTLGSMLTSQTASNVTELLLADDTLSLNVILTQLVRSDSVASARILDIDERIITAAGNEPEAASPLQLRYSAPIALEDSLAGYVTLTLDPAPFNADSSQRLTYYAVLLGAGLIFCLFTALALGQHLRRPIERVRQALDDPQHARLAELVPDNELGALEESCALFVQRYLDQFSELYGDSASFSDDSTAARFQGTSILLCIQLCQTDKLLALLNPTTLTTLLDQYYALLSRAARLYGGELLRFSGDSQLLAFADDNQDPIIRAICCAQLFQMLVGQLNDKHRAAGSPSLAFSAAIHCGEILLTQAGSDQASSGTSSALGLAVNETLALAACQAPGTIAISDDCHQRISGTPPEYVSRITAEETEDGAEDADSLPLIHYILGPVLSEHQQLIESQAERIMNPATEQIKPPTGQTLEHG